MAFANDTLFVADSNRLGLLPIMNRVVMYTGINRGWPQPPRRRSPPTRAAARSASARRTWCSASRISRPPSNLPDRTQNGMNLPLAVASDGVHVAVADTANNRVLIWNKIPTTTNQNADIVLGQPDFVTFRTRHAGERQHHARAARRVDFQTGSSSWPTRRTIAS